MHNIGCAPVKALNDDAARAALRKALGQEGTGKVAHHLIPLEAEKKFGNLLERGRRGGFDINVANNGRLVDPTDHIGGHPQYNKAVLDELGRIED
ncbi:AHH domain-containing protein [Aeoliella mucimassa]|uniref:AHH domain-containing protein n=1 Tax=Aeoliella mucimassa TaxID=2527972 RepID=UPI0018D2ED4A